ncbi:hypothetical protein POF53_08250 [Mitsuaria sp. RG]|nr:hypothetical protein [Mitsuaria sp. RG]
MIVLASLLLSGAFGGVVARITASAEGRLSCLQHMAIGVCASLMVPLFLNTISSTLVSDILKSNEFDLSKLLVLVGFSLVASVSSLRFIRGLSEKFLQELSDTKEKAAAAESKARTALQIVEQSEPGEAEVEEEQSKALLSELSALQKKLLAHMCTGPYTMRSATGLSKELGVSTTESHETLSYLASKGLVESGLNSRNEMRWYPSASGRVVGMTAAGN